MIIYGWRSVYLKSADSRSGICPHCNHENSLRHNIYSRHIHVFWIPAFPIGKTGIVECSHCKYSMRTKEMPEAIRRENNEFKRKVRFPFWLFTGLGLFLLFVILVISLNLKSS